MNAPSKIHGYRCKKLRCFKRIFKEWIHGVTEIADQWAEYRDVPWWYPELV